MSKTSSTDLITVSITAAYTRKPPTMTSTYFGSSIQLVIKLLLLYFLFFCCCFMLSTRTHSNILYVLFKYI